MKKHYLFLSLLFVLLLLAACSGSTTTETEKPDETDDTTDTVTETGNETTEEDRELVIAIGSDMLGFDIHNHNNTSTEAIHQNMFDYLFKRDENNVLQPWLAESYEIVDDTTIEVVLKQGVKFHNGDEFTAEDVKFTLERVATDSALKENPNYKQIKEVKIVDPYTVQIITHAPEPSIIHRLARLGSGMLPKKYIDENGWDHFLENPIGTGPYQFVEWVRDDRIVFEPYNDYFLGKVDEWDKVTFRVIPENSTRVSELLAGGVDIATNIPPADWERVESNDGTSIKQEVSNRTLFLVLRATEGLPTSDVRVRQAIDYAIDDGTLTEFALQGAGIPTLTMVGPGNFGHEPSLYNTYNYDLEKAKQLLAEAGYPNGFEMTLHASKGRYLQDGEVAELIVGMLAQAGITVNLEFSEWSKFVELRNANENKEAYLLGLGNSLYDGAFSLDRFHTERFVGHTDYSNAEVDAILNESRTNMDSATREQQLQEIQKIVAEDVPYITLYQEKINTGVSDAINYAPTSDEMIYVPTITRK